MDLDILEKQSRLLMEVDLRPVAGDRFQPTGFADIGAAEYKRPDGTAMLLVESAQSVANRLEKTVVDGESGSLDPALAGLPYVTAELEGLAQPVTTSSLVEAHRIASPYFLLNKQFNAVLVKEMGYGPKLPLNWQKIYATLFKYDPNSLIHGVFLSLLEGGRVRAPRALTGFIEACKVEKVLSGGVKNSPVDPTGKTAVADPAPGAKTGEAGVYSNVPYARVEYTAEKITAYFNLDLSLIRGYKLGDGASDLLIHLALLKIRRFLDGSLRLRTACDLQVAQVRGFELPAEGDLLSAVQAGIQACGEQFAKPPVTALKTKVKVIEKPDKASV